MLVAKYLHDIERERERKKRKKLNEIGQSADLLGCMFDMRAIQFIKSFIKPRLNGRRVRSEYPTIYFHKNCISFLEGSHGRKRRRRHVTLIRAPDVGNSFDDFCSYRVLSMARHETRTNENKTEILRWHFQFSNVGEKKVEWNLIASV